MFHFDQVLVLRIAAKTLLAGALIWMVLPVVRIMDDAGWFGVAVGTVRGLAGIVSDFAFLFLALMEATYTATRLYGTNRPLIDRWSFAPQWPRHCVPKRLHGTAFRLRHCDNDGRGKSVAW